MPARSVLVDTAATSASASTAGSVLSAEGPTHEALMHEGPTHRPVPRVNDPSVAATPRGTLPKADLPAPSRALPAHSLADLLRNAEINALVDDVLVAFVQAGIAVLPIKGAVILRQCGTLPWKLADLDVLVHPGSYADAQCLLESTLGGRLRGLHHQESSWTLPSGLTVDVHRKAFHYGRFRKLERALWDESQVAPHLFAVPTYILPPALHLTLLYAKATCDALAPTHPRYAALREVQARLGVHSGELTRTAKRYAVPLVGLGEGAPGDARSSGPKPPRLPWTVGTLAQSTNPLAYVGVKLRTRLRRALRLPSEQLSSPAA